MHAGVRLHQKLYICSSSSSSSSSTKSKYVVILRILEVKMKDVKCESLDQSYEKQNESIEVWRN